MTVTALRVDRPSAVYERLRSLIIRGRLAPGLRIIESDVAAKLEVSRTPVREAVQRLHQEGFLVAAPSTRRTELLVAPLTASDLVDLYRLMAGLESTAVIGVMDLEASPRKAIAARLRQAESSFEVAARSEPVDFDLLFELHNAFHDTFVTPGAGPRLRAVLETIRPQIDRYEWMYAPLVGPDYEHTFREHRAIIRAVRDGDREAARDAVTANWEHGAERLRVVIERVGERGPW